MQISDSFILSIFKLTDEEIQKVIEKLEELEAEQKKRNSTAQPTTADSAIS